MGTRPNGQKRHNSPETEDLLTRRINHIQDNQGEDLADAVRYALDLLFADEEEEDDIIFDLHLALLFSLPRTTTIDQPSIDHLIADLQALKDNYNYGRNH